MKKTRTLLCAIGLAMCSLGLLLILCASLSSIEQVQARVDPSEPQVLARVEIAGTSDLFDLPIYAHLQDATGRDYALVIASLSRLQQADVSYRIVDGDALGATYILALERRSGARQRAAQSFAVLYDDGRQLVLRATPDSDDQVETLAELGFDVQRLDAPLVWREPTGLVAPEAVTYDPIVAEMIAQVQQSTVYTYDGQLSGKWPAVVGGVPYTISTRYTNSGQPIQNATQYVYERMQALGLTVSYHNWTGGGYSNRNVVGILTGTVRSNEIVLITAHLDDLPSSGRAPGADDNASGSVGVLVAADILSQYHFERTMRFVFFTGEEQGLYGSQAYATLAYNAGENIVAVYNMDMIAGDSVDGPTLRLHTRTTSNPGYLGDLAIAGVFTNVVNAYGLGSSLTPILDPDGITASDHSSFWNRGYSAILAIEDDLDDFNTYYHTLNDQLQYLNMAYSTNYVKASVGTAAHLASPAQRGYLTGTIYDGTHGGELAGAAVRAHPGAGQTFTTTSNVGGLYSLSVPSGTYTVTATALGYMPFITTGITVMTNLTTTLDITLQVTPTFIITGYAYDAVTHQPLSATVSVPGSAAWATQTDPSTGWYSFSLPLGNHILQADAVNYQPSARAITVTTSQQQDFALQPSCLLVVADDGGMGWDTYYTAALNRLGRSYRLVSQAPDLDTLEFYQGVVWLTGNQSTNTLTSVDQANLAAYLDGAGRLFVSGQDIGLDIGGSNFYEQYLHAAFHSDDTNIYALTGLDWLNGLDVTIQGGDGANNQFYPSDIGPVNGSVGVYRYPDPYLYGGVAYSGTYRMVYLSFGYEAINSRAQRDAVMSATMNYLGVCGTPQAPRAGFVSDSPTQWGIATQFTNTTQGTAWITYTWNFGDGTFPDHSANPAHQYLQPGVYTVVLTATSRYGASVYSDTVAVVSSCAPVTSADFSFTPPAPRVGETVTFSGTSAGGTSPVTYTWTFGDGSVGNRAVVTHPFPMTAMAKTYTVMLLAANACTSPAVSVNQSISIEPFRIYLPIILR